MKLAILDRDGVINEERGGLGSPADWRPLPGSVEAIARLCHAGFRVFVASRLPGSGSGIDHDALFAVHERMHRAVSELGGRIEGVVYAPGPRSTMLPDLAKRLGTGLERAYVVGDSLNDIECARAARAIPVLVRTGQGRETEPLVARWPDVTVFDTLAAFAAAVAL